MAGYRFTAAVLILIGGLIGPGLARAGDAVHVVCSTALKEVLQELAPAFERTSGDRLVLEFESSAAVKRKIDAGAAFDVAIVTPAMIADLAQQGRIVAGSAVQIARAGYGVAIRAGAPRPDISTVAAFRAAVLNARSIMYNKDGQSGAYMSALMERLGIAEQMRPRTVLKLVAGPVAADVADGTAELGFQSISEIIPVRGAELLGPLPAELQNYTYLSAGVGAASKVAVAGQRVIRFLASPEAAQAMTKHGLEALAR